MKRKDSWSNENDLLLAQTVIDCVIAGKSQMEGFEEAAKKLQRTATACGFRWNSEVRKQYREALMEAKMERKSQKKSSLMIPVELAESQSPSELHSAVDTETTMDPLQLLGKAVEAVALSYRQLQKENQMLKKQLSEMPQQDDIVALVQLMERARELGLVQKNLA